MTDGLTIKHARVHAHTLTSTHTYPPPGSETEGDVEEGEKAEHRVSSEGNSTSSPGRVTDPE